MVHEVLTLQFGGFANYVGAHYWNIQDELAGLQQQQGPALDICSDILFREGQTVHGESTYTPRLIIIDSQGSLGATSRQGFLYQQPSAVPSSHIAATWTGRHEVHRSQPVAKTAFQQELEAEQDIDYDTLAAAAAAAAGNVEFENVVGQEPSSIEQAATSLDAPGAVRFFTDYLKTHLHPRSTCLLPGTWDAASKGGQSSVSSGIAGSWMEQGWSEGREEALDRVRLFAEESDSLQGFQCLVQEATSWGGLAAATLQDLRDEYPGRPVVVFALQPPREPGQEVSVPAVKKKQVEQAMLIAALSQQCDTYIPGSAPTDHRSFPSLQWRTGDWFHEAALCAAVIDGATLPYRLDPIAASGPGGPVGQIDMRAYTQLLAGSCSSPLAGMRLSMPCPELPTDEVGEGEISDGRLHRHLGHQPPPDLMSSAASMTPGLSFTSKRDPEQHAECSVLRGACSQGGGAPADVSTALQELDASLLRENLRCVRHRVVTRQPFPVPLPYPSIFRSPASLASCCTLTRVSGTAAFAPVVESHQVALSRAWTSAQGQSAVREWGWGKEEQMEHAEYLLQLGQNYRDFED